MEEEVKKTRRRKVGFWRRFARHLWWIIPVVLLLGLIGGAVYAADHYMNTTRPYLLAENAMPEDGSMVLSALEDGTIELRWPAGRNVDQYTVEVFTETGEILFSSTTQERACILKSLPKDRAVTIRISCEKAYVTGEGESVRPGETVLEVTDIFRIPSLQGLEWVPDHITKLVDIHYTLQENQVCRMVLSHNNGQEEWLRVLEDGHTQFKFEDGTTWPIPTFEDTYDVFFQVYTQGDGYRFYGNVTKEISVTREDFLGTELQLTCEDLGFNQYTFTWNETKGEHYELQSYDADSESWVTVHEVPKTGTRAYTTGHLDRYTDYTFRVVAVGGQTLPDSEFAAVPGEASVSTGASLIYSTIWPNQDLEVYSDAEKTEVIGTAGEGTAYCILAMENGLFRVKYEDTFGYIDSNYCMINLPEFIGDLCSYDITNSYSSVFMVHDYEIEDVTDTTIRGYEYVRTGYDEYLVPLLYPTALKLEKAAFAALEEGVRLKIYDAYRPGRASLSVHDLTKAILEDPVPETTFTGEPAKNMPEVAEGEVLTFYQLMTDFGRYYLENFITDYDSKHNMGIALDLTLETATWGSELGMQSAIHDLSHYAEVYDNNSNANWLRSIMRNAGFGTLASEWWHFQDNEIRSTVDLKYLWIGISPECWMADDNGWRYRDRYGDYYEDCTVTIGDREYTFDADGYVLGPPDI